MDLQLETLRETKLEEDIRSRLGRLPETLEDSYQVIYNAIQKSGDYASRLADAVFQWLLYARRTMPVEEFAAMLSTTTRASKVALKPEIIVDICTNLVEIDRSQNIFRFVHLSVREFFEKQHDRGESRFTPSQGHASLAQSCLSYLCSTLAPGTLHDVAQDPLTEETCLLLSSCRAMKRYTDGFWLEHTKLCGKERKNSPLQVLFSLFLRKDVSGSSIHDQWACSASFDNYGLSEIEIQRCWAATRRPAHPIWIACAFDFVELVDMCYNGKGFDIEMKTGVYLTPLLEASRLGSEKVFLRLVELGADLNARTPRYRKGAIDFAIENGHVALIEQIKKYDDDDVEDKVQQKETNGEKGQQKPDQEESRSPEDDIALCRDQHSRYVDYLSHHWKEEDIWSSWKHIVSKRTAYDNSARL